MSPDHIPFKWKFSRDIQCILLVQGQFVKYKILKCFKNIRVICSTVVVCEIKMRAHSRNIQPLKITTLKYTL